MFEFIRSHQRLMMMFLILVIIPPFLLFGLEGYLGLSEGSNLLAKVEGQGITQSMFEQEQRRQFDRLQQALGDSFDPAQFDNQALRTRLLDSLIRQRLLEHHRQRERLSVSDRWLQERIASEPTLQTNGQFDTEKYQAFLLSRGTTAQAFEEELRYRESTVRYSNVIAATAFLPQTVAARLLSIALEQRDVQPFIVKPADFMALVHIDDAAIKAYYDHHAQDFSTPETIDIEYIVLDQRALGAKIQIPNADILTYYQAHQARFSTPEERRARHILISVPANANPADKAKARQHAEEVLSQVKAKPNDFAALARQYSEDTGSAAQGGDLGFFGRDLMTKPFEERVFSLKENEISDIVESEFGFHIIQLTGIKAAKIQPLSTVRDQIESELRANEAVKKYADAAEMFTNLVYEQADSLKPAAEQLGLAIQTLAHVGRNGLSTGSSPILNKKMLSALFSNDALINHRNTEAIELAPNTLAAAHVVQHTPTTRRTLADARPEILAILTQQEAQKLAVKSGQEKLAKLLQKPDDSLNEINFGEVTRVSRHAPNGLDGRAIKAIFSANARALPTFVGIDLGHQGYAIYRINQIGRMTLDATKQAQLETEIQRAGSSLGNAQETAAYEVLKSRSKIDLIHIPGATNSNG